MLTPFLPVALRPPSTPTIMTNKQTRLRWVYSNIVTNKQAARENPAAASQKTHNVPENPVLFEVNHPAS